MIVYYVRWAIELGCKIIQLGITTGVNAEETARLYERLGFAKIGTLHEFRGW